MSENPFRNPQPAPVPPKVAAAPNTTGATRAPEATPLAVGPAAPVQLNKPAITPNAGGPAEHIAQPAAPGEAWAAQTPELRPSAVRAVAPEQQSKPAATPNAGGPAEHIAQPAAPEGEPPGRLPPPVTEVQAGWYNPAEPGKADQPPSQAGWRKSPELGPTPPPLVEPSSVEPLPAAPEPMMGPSRSWMALFSGLAWIVLCFELGAFLLVYPWMDGWDQNYFATLRPAWHDVWVNPWIRGAVSGLGTVNILIALIELFRYLRHWLFD